MGYILPREIFIGFEEAFGKEKAQLIADSLEKSIDIIVKESNQSLKIHLKDELKSELITREIFEERFKTLEIKFEERFKLLDFKLNIVIGIAVLALTLFNPALLAFLTKVFKL